MAVYRCSRGKPGYGVIAPLIVPGPGGRRVSSTDFRNYVGVFAGPVNHAGGGEGTPWGRPDLHFDREQYGAEIEHASRDRNWETGRRKTARLVYEHLEPPGLILSPDLRLAGASPAWRGDAWLPLFRRLTRAPRFEVRQQVLLLTSTLDDRTRQPGTWRSGCSRLPRMPGWSRSVSTRPDPGSRHFTTPD